MPHDDPRIHEKLASHGWDTLRPVFERIHRGLLALAPEATAELTTIYVKYMYSPEPSSQIFSVVWIKTTKEIVVGLVLPEQERPSAFLPKLLKHNYAPLNAFLVLHEGDLLPDDFDKLIRLSFESRKKIGS